MRVASGPTELIDLHHLGRERVIGCWRVGDVLVDPGPASCLDALLAGLQGERPRALALTHIHLDHAGAAGSLVSRWPDLEVWVHELGAPHLARPAMQLASARRLYGADMDRLWGEVIAVPMANLRPLGDRGTVGALRYVHAPGHASHHVAYLHEPTGRAFTGDVAGVRIAPAGYVLPPTPPPDIDLEAWRDSLAKLRTWDPSSLAITHFGAYTDVQAQLGAVEAELDELAALAGSLELEAFTGALRGRVARGADPHTAAVYEQAVPPDQVFAGLRRYLQKRPSS